MCAPTGAGKTNVGMLCILQQLGRARLQSGEYDLGSFKVIYISPMKVREGAGMQLLTTLERGR